MTYRHEFASALASDSMPVPSLPIDDGVLYRFHIEGDKTGSLNGWYVLHGGRVPAGAYGSWKTGFKNTWRANTGTALTQADRDSASRLIAAAKQQRRDEQQRLHQAAAQSAAQFWASASPADANHAYLQAKQVKPYGLRQTGKTLLAPLHAAGKLVNLQRITPDGQKKFLYDGQVTGAYYPIRGPQGELYICEGVATAHTIHALIGVSVVAAMNCGNLKPVAQYFRCRYPDLPITLAADNDHSTAGNPGITKATEAAAAVEGLIVWPRFPAGAQGTDFNDLAVMGVAQ
jgi:putative DNA primase/helicase